MRKLIMFATGVVLATNFGCSTIQSKVAQNEIVDQLQAPESQETRIYDGRNPSLKSIAVIWRENVLKTNGHKPVRGFTGRVYFHDKNQELLRVEGELTIHGYDDSSHQSRDVADRVYKFPPERFQQHYNASELGHSYAIWIPWPKEDRYRKSIALIPTFKTLDGEVFQGRMSLLTLSGDPPPDEDVVEKRVIKPARSSVRAQVGDAPENKRRTETFELPYGLANRLSNSVPLKAPQSRRASPEVLQHLTDLELSEKNPNGARYNRPVVFPPEAMQDKEGVGIATQQNFSDTAPVSTSAPVRSPASARTARQNLKSLRVFGKPGQIR